LHWPPAHFPYFDGPEFCTSAFTISIKKLDPNEEGQEMLRTWSGIRLVFMASKKKVRNISSSTDIGLAGVLCSQLSTRSRWRSVKRC
jgi:hypothetical protein